MRALTRMRLLATVCALLLLMLAPIATANVPGRPIDRPDGPPDPDPTMVGDPDQPGGNVTIVFLNHVFVFRFSGFPSWLRIPATTGDSPKRFKNTTFGRTRHAH